MTDEQQWGTDRITMQAVRRELVGKPVAVDRYPIRDDARCPGHASTAQYQRIMSELCAHAKVQGIEASAFGGVCLEDIRASHEHSLRGIGLKLQLAVRSVHTSRLTGEMIGAGLRVKAACADP